MADHTGSHHVVGIDADRSKAILMIAFLLKLFVRIDDISM